ncbi:tyrosine-protein phosphatase non-receptor type 2-like [Hyalella azteca]|uniref:Tyrosine-protein phosphatase non-receptor type 2-like n=1 Tax=Hyalella azteca TaxID=294128 RepID=A0A8B7PJB0_HYAAZ|nr:tyrosine-protein phosphatase non-receptor type 2-like [Hyalella azteca]
MIGDFIEDNAESCGQYFSYDGVVMLQDPPVSVMVTMLSTETTSSYNVSRLQVKMEVEGKSVLRDVTHYHYAAWPQQGDPSDTLALASMLLDIASSHPKMHAVVHCNSGVGRSGAVIYTMICYDHLLASGKLDVIAVLEGVLQDRASLVDSPQRFQLCLQLLDELLFGFKTLTSENEFHGKFLQLLHECPEWLAGVNTLPSSLTFSEARSKQYTACNRSPEVLPADRYRITMQNAIGQPQYINAILLDGLQKDRAYIVTEHPLPGRLEHFWNLVLTQKTPAVVVLNARYDENFPELLPPVGATLRAATVEVKTVAKMAAASHLICHRVSVAVGATSAAVLVYEVMDWPRGMACPLDVSSLVRLADTCCSSPNKSAGPTVLVCGDGVTACGLAAGVLSVVDRLKERQDVDVYRTAVKRQQFIINEAQLQCMLQAARTYLSDFRVYQN